MAVVWPLVAGATLLKLLFISAYRSTDFEVHRNWLAITHSLPLNKWYTEDTSEWTLDYPPLFAWFEWLLSLVAQFVDPEMLVVSNLNYASQSTVLFQRLSVIFTDFVYIYAITEFQNVSSLMMASKKNNVSFMDFAKRIVPILLIFNVGLFMVDHIHFQYNGMLFGILLLSITRILEEKHMEGAFWFSILLNMKHIFLYFAPAYFIYLLRAHCFEANKQITFHRFSFKNLLGLGSVVKLVFVLSLGPFMFMRQYGQLLSRLFPFKRGLVHAYWAPNFWALYSGVDKVFTFLCVRLNLISRDSVPQASMTGGMVQEYEHIVLPSIPPLVTLILTVLAMAPALVILWRQPTKTAFVRTVILCGFSSFLFGWHVHEKAILMILIPMTLLVLNSRADARLFLILSVTGFYSLFPLIFSPLENIIKVIMLIISSGVSFEMLSTYHASKSIEYNYLPLLDAWESAYVLGFVLLGFFNSVCFWLFQLDRYLPFLPLMLTSLYCSIGIIYCWICFYKIFDAEETNNFATQRFKNLESSQNKSESSKNKSESSKNKSESSRNKSESSKHRS